MAPRLEFELVVPLRQITYQLVRVVLDTVAIVHPGKPTRGDTSADEVFKFLPRDAWRVWGPRLIVVVGCNWQLGVLAAVAAMEPCELIT